MGFQCPLSIKSMDEIDKHTAVIATAEFSYSGF